MSKKIKRKKPKYLEGIVSAEDIISNIACSECRAEFDITKEVCSNCGAPSEKIKLFRNEVDRKCELCNVEKEVVFPKKVKYKNVNKIMLCCIECVSEICKK